MGGGSSKTRVSDEEMKAAARQNKSGSKVTFQTDVCAPTAAPTDPALITDGSERAGESGMGARGVQQSPLPKGAQFAPQGTAESTGGVLRTFTSYDAQAVEKNKLSQSEADMERLKRTVWIHHIPLNYAIPEKLMELFEATAVPQVAKIRVKDSDVPGAGQVAWALLTFKYEEGAQNVCKQQWTVNDGSEDVELEVKMCDVEKALKSPLSGAVAVKQWGIAFSNRWGACTVHSSCLAYASAIRVKGSEGGGPCTSCGCYCAAHINLGHYPSRCAVDGCPCAEFRPENDPTNMVVEEALCPPTDDQGPFVQLHRNTVCGMCGHKSADHTAPKDRWEVRWPDIDVLEKLGEGRHGRVHRCMLWNKAYAVKILKNENWTGSALSNFLREMSTLASMRHPHIQELVAGITDTKAARKGTGSLAIVTTLAENGDLRDVIIKQPPQVTESMWINMALDIAKGMEYLHGLSPPIIHRDLKPMNCMVDGKWRVRVADFALSGTIKGEDEEGDGGAYDTSMDAATPTTETQAAYMPPELLKITTAKTALQAMKDNKMHKSSGMLMSRDQHGNLQARVSSGKLTAMASRRSTGVDTWAFGMLLWAIVHRRRPFTGWDATAVVQHILKACDDEELPLDLSAPPPDPGREDSRPEEERSTFCRESTADLLQQCWQQEPEARPVFSDIIDSMSRIRIEAIRTEEEARAARRAKKERARTEAGGLADTSSYVSHQTRTIDVATDIEMLDLTGSGGFGKVYRGLWAGTEVAVKLLHNQDMSKKLLDEMKAEVQVLQQLHHPNIVMLMGMCTKPPNVSIITEFLGKAGKPDANGKVTYINSLEQVTTNPTDLPFLSTCLLLLCREVSVYRLLVALLSRARLI
jgi:serine/threonine protein kinase